MIILSILAVGALVGWIAKMLIPSQRGAAWGPVIIAGLIGSLVGGALANLIFGSGLHFAFTGLVGSVLGAVVVLLIWKPATTRRT